MKKRFSKYIQYKDSVFYLLFSDQDKLRNLYNALTNSSYNKKTPVTITTLKNVLSMGLRNDISFTIGEKNIVFVEHQSTINPQIPIRLLLYAAATYEKMIPRKELYSTRELKIPSPEFYLFYNGLSSFPEKTTLRLSHCFKEIKEKEKPCLELEVKAYNINVGYNKVLMEKSRDLREYVQFVEAVRKKQPSFNEKEDREEAFRLAIKECIEHNILREFLEKHEEEVMSSLLSITMEEYIEIRVEEGREEGLAKGRLEGRTETLLEAEEKIRETARELKSMGLSLEQITKATKLSPKEIEKL